MRQLTSIVLFSALHCVFIRADEISYDYNTSLQSYWESTALSYDYENNETVIDIDNSEIDNNDTTINVTEQITMFEEISKSQNYFDSNYIYELNDNDILQNNMTRREHPVEIEASPDSFRDSYIIELCDSANETDNQNILTYTKINDNNETLVDWYMFITDDFTLPINSSHNKWILTTNETTNQAIMDIASFSAVCYVVADSTVSSSYSSWLGSSWGLDRIDQVSLPLDNTYSGAWINKKKYDGSGVAVYVFDTGIRTTHQEFKNRPSGSYVINTYDFYNCPWPGYHCYSKPSILYGNNDGHGHGTHVSGVIGGKHFGVAPGCMIHGVKVLRDSDGTAPTSIVISSISRLIFLFREHKSRNQQVIVSMSFGTPHHGTMDRAIQTLYNMDIISVVAAGNDRQHVSKYSPAGEPKAITVMATDEIDKLWISNYNPNKGSNHGGDISAPGRSIISSWITSDTELAWKSGTSMACPFVTGILTTYFQQNKGLTIIQAITKLYQNSAQKISDTISRSGNIVLGGYLALVPRDKPSVSCYGTKSNGHWDYCSPSCKCKHGEGDCDSNRDCESGTYCESNNGPDFGMSKYTDVCVSDSTTFPMSNLYTLPTPSPVSQPTPRPLSPPTPKPVSPPTPRPVSPPTSELLIPPTPSPTVCHGIRNNGDAGYCRIDCKCQHNEGQCSSDNDCINGTQCIMICTRFVKGGKRCVSWNYMCILQPTLKPTLEPTLNPSKYPLSSLPTSLPTYTIPPTSKSPTPLPTQLPTIKSGISLLILFTVAMSTVFGGFCLLYTFKMININRQKNNEMTKSIKATRV